MVVVVHLAGDAPTATNLRVPNDGGSAGVSMQRVPLGTPFGYITYDLCVTSGSATITQVEPKDTQGSIEVIDGAVLRPQDWTSGEVIDGRVGTAAGLPGFTHAPIASRCSDHSGVTESWTRFALSVKVASPAAVANGFTIHYRSDGNEGTAFVPFSITECTGAVCPRLASAAPTGGR